MTTHWKIVVSSAVAACSKTSRLLRKGTRFHWKSAWLAGPVPSPGGFFKGLLAVLASVHLAGLPSANGSEVIAWGMNLLGAPTTNTPPGLANVVAVETAPSLSLALKADGTIAVWGDNNQGQIDAIARLTNVAAISGGFTHVLALKRDGTVDAAAWGNFAAAQTNIPSNLSNVVAVAAGGRHSLALRNDGTVVAWGESTTGSPFTLPPGLSNVVEIQATAPGGIALKADGTVVALGGGFATPPPPGLTNVVAISTAFSANFLALRSDGSVAVWTSRNGTAGFRDLLPEPDNLDALVAVSVEQYHCLAIAADGSLRSWRLRDAPVPPPEPYLQIPEAAATDVIAIAAGRAHNLVLVGEPGWPRILTQPENILATDGQAGTFRLEAASALPLQYQWYFNGAILAGATNDTVTIDGVNASKAGPYAAVVSAGPRKVRSQPAWLTVVPTIQANLESGQVKLSWPRSGAEYWLEEADGASQPFRTAFENIVTNELLGRFEVTIASSDQPRFFRLWQP
jgi:hypothetical protein